MAIRTKMLLLSALALAIGAPQASAQGLLPDPVTHVDAAGEVGDRDAPRLTFLDPDTDAGDLRSGYLYLRARCDVRCVLEVTASTRIKGKWREVATTSRTLRTNRVTRLRMKIRADVRRRIANGARFRFEAVPLPVPEE
jgi:hypothetical protein